MLGANGPQISSKTVWRNQSSKYERIDVENPNPGERAGQVHYYDEKNVFKYDGSDELTPLGIQKNLNNKDIQIGIQKGLRYLGEE